MNLFELPVGIWYKARLSQAAGIKMPGVAKLVIIRYWLRLCRQLD